LGERTLKISNSIMVSSRAMSIEPCAKKSVSSRRLSHKDGHDEHLASHTHHCTRTHATLVSGDDLHNGR
jgi:hypothetical protein